MRIIEGEARGRKLLTPRDNSIRPPLDRIRESLFSIVRGVFEGRLVLDLFAGTGSLGLEALSRGARRVVFVEKAKRSLEVLEQNIRNLGFQSRSEVERGDGLVLPRLASLEAGCMALAFLDPPFPMWDGPSGSSGLTARVSQIIESEAMDPEGIAILRLPSKNQGALGVSHILERTYGESRVLFFSRQWRQ